MTEVTPHIKGHMRGSSAGRTTSSLYTQNSDPWRLNQAHYEAAETRNASLPQLHYFAMP